MEKEQKLIECLHGIKVNNDQIDLYDRIIRIKESAKTEWLVDLGKNGYDHSERLESYLNKLTKDLQDSENINPAEIFVLLAATYMHDIGYRYEDKTPYSPGHPQRSRKMIRNKWSKYHFNDFPEYNKSCPIIAEAVGMVCCGHSYSITLEKIPNNFHDATFGTLNINLRKLTALLRIADEADDPYIRFNPSKTIRDRISLVEIGKDTIVWHWNGTTQNDVYEFQILLDEKMKSLESSLEYLSDITGRKRYLTLDPQIKRTIPSMGENPTESFVGRENDLQLLHNKMNSINAGSIIVISGIGGIGKTEFAKKYVNEYRNEYPGGIFWISLKGSTWQNEARKLINTAFQGENISRSF